MEKKYALISVTSRHGEGKYNIELTGTLFECKRAYRMILDDANGVVIDLARDIIMLQTIADDGGEIHVIYRITSEEDALRGWPYRSAPTYQDWLEARRKDVV